MGGNGEGGESGEGGHTNASAATTVTAAAAPAGTTEPRRIGVRPDGAYWGGAGEQIDLRSGNLNYTVPLFKAMARGGWGVPFALNYNSQDWSQSSGRTWRYGRDIGYGFGWRLLAGSILPVYAGAWALDHYVFTDSTGAEYRLDQQTGGIWSSKEGFYGTYDPSTSRLSFPDGSWWEMTVTSNGNEEDAGTQYPAKFHDTNGNRIEVDYMAGVGMPWDGSSSRIKQIRDARTNGAPAIYWFSYNTDPVPHLTGIYFYPNGVTRQTHAFTYLGNQTLASPFDGSIAGASWLLQKVTTPGLNTSTAFQYDTTSGEMTQMTTPLGGSLGWSYRTYTYAGGRSYREVTSRYLTGSTNTSPWTWNLALDSNPNLHATATLTDVGAGSKKVWTFGSNGLTASYEEGPSSGAALLHKDYTWTVGPLPNQRPYVGSVVTTLNPGTGQAQTKTEQTLDLYGNITQSKAYDYGNLTTPARTYNYTYLHAWQPAYANYNILNRVLSVSVTAGGQTNTVLSNAYDNGWLGTANPNAILWTDPGTTYRGNVSARFTPAGLTTSSYDMMGTVTSSTNESGVTVAAATDASTSYSLPSVITPGGESNLATSFAYNGAWSVTSVTGANGANATTQYDNYERPTSSKIPDGATTTYTYTYLPNTQTATLGSRWTRTTLDGFGRTVKVETGHDAVTVSVAETEYAPCACSPLGKLWRTSRPHAPGASPQWTTHTYDASGRTLSVTLPDGSVTRYEYTGNTTKVTDAAGKWKKQTADAFGNLVLVTEPSPAGGADWTTSYGYNVINKLTSVAMPRPYGGGTYTQTRSFSYATTSAAVVPGWVVFPNGVKPTIYANLVSETNPETGTITYQYDSNNRMTTRTDAKGWQVLYWYDGFGRVTHRSYNQPTGGGNAAGYSDVTYHYDNPVDAQFTQNGWGRLTGVDYNGRTENLTFQYLYSYNAAGRVTGQRMVVRRPPPGNNPGTGSLVAEATYGWDNEGRMTSLQEPDGGPLDTYTYDEMGRLASGGATYGPAGELLTFNGVTRQYNALGQLTRMTKANVMDVEYLYPSQNNGRIAQSHDYVTGEVVSYTYDALNRLSRAETADAAWGNAYTYDGWGNLLSKSVTKGTAPAMTQSYDPSLNMPTGSPLPSAPADPAQFDAEMRTLRGAGELTTTAGELSFDPNGKKVAWTYRNWEGVMQCEVYFHSITGQRLARYTCGIDEWNDERGITHFDFWASVADRTQHIGGQLTSWNGEGATTDRLGSVRAKGAERYTYYPYGEVRTATGSNGLYAGLESPLRKYDANLGRFDRPDPLGLAGVVMGDPGSWNRFAYVAGDPVNFHDSAGTNRAAVEGGYNPWGYNCGPGWASDASLSGPCEWWGWDWGGGGGGGGGFLPADPNPTITAAERKRRQAAIVAAFAAIGKTIKELAEQNAKPETWPLYIKFLSSCASAGAAGVQLQVTYQVYNNLGQPMTSNLDGFSITESFNNQTGNLQNLNGQAATWSRSNNTLFTNGQFVDVLEGGIGRSGTALQEFTASGWFGTQPLGIEFGSTDYNGVNFNSYTSSGITVNGVGATNGVCGR